MHDSLFAAALHPDRSYYGGPSHECPYCGAVFWYQERVKKSSTLSKRKIVYNVCCKGGKIELPELRIPPPFLAKFSDMMVMLGLSDFLDKSAHTILSFHLHP